MDKPWKVVFAFVGVFIAGAVFGGFFALRIGGRVLQMDGLAIRGKAGSPQDRPQPQQRPLIASVEPVRAAQIMRRYAEQLELTPEQKERINPLIQRATEDLRRQQQTNFRESSIILQRLQEDLAKELTPDQRKRLEKLEQKQRDLRMLYGGRGAAGPRPPGERDGARAGSPGGPGAPKPPPDGGEGKGMRPQPPAPEPGDAGK